MRQTEPGARGVVILVSPAPVDGYPPVQYQAQLLADAGLHVLLLTSNLKPGHPAEFDYPGVDIIRVPLQRTTRLGRLTSKVAFARRLLRLRLRHGRRVCTEIAYDAEGVSYAFAVPGRRSPIVAHLHEVVGGPPDQPSILRWVERFALRFLRECDRVVVPDADRAVILRDQALLAQLPTVVRNLPVRRDTPALPDTTGGYPFSVVYHGSIGYSQALDSVVTSMPLWPPCATLHIYGNPQALIRTELDALATEVGVVDRVRWEGWVQLEGLEHRLRQHSIGLSLLRPWHPNWQYASGASNKRYQYIRAGLPQITDRNLGVPELVEGNGVGRCVDPDSPEQIAEAVRFYHDHPDEWAAAAERAARLHRDELYYEQEFEPVLDFVRLCREGKPHLALHSE